tara:strand:+ start:611 stop:985 length:375 start_codon:yes stop_codon:yes gene_type:complete
MHDEYQAVIEKKNRKLDDQATMKRNALTGQRDSFKATEDAFKSQIKSLKQKLAAVEAEVNKVEDQAELDEEAHAQEISEEVAIYEQDEKKLKAEVERLEAKLKSQYLASVPFKHTPANSFRRFY